MWTISVFFYSLTLLLGYIYANQLVQWPSRIARLIHSGLLLVSSGLLLSVWLKGSTPPLIDTIFSQVPAVSVLLTLLAALGLPILILASVSILMQSLYAKYTGAEPYRLYALSNIGSLLGLLSYPFFLENVTSLTWQAGAWTTGFIVCTLLILSSWRQVEKSLPSSTQSLANVKHALQQNRLMIVVLAAVPTFLMVTFTEFLSKGIASFPLLWVVPLALYLLSFIVAFGERRTRILRAPLPVVALASAVPVIALLQLVNDSAALFFCTFLYMMVFFYLVSLYVHRRIYDLRPDASALGSFYVYVTFGGAVGSGIVGFVLPALLNDVSEFYIAVSAITVYFLFHAEVKKWSTEKLPKLFAQAFKGLVIVLAILVSANHLLGQEYVVSERNFFGTLKVVDTDMQVYGESVRVRSLVNGATNHGLQALDERYAASAVSYYGPGSGIDIALQTFVDRGVKPRVSAVGLGAGVINTYCTDVSAIDYIEINPAVEHLARSYFTYLDMCAEETTVTIGDGRLVLEEWVKEGMQTYDVIVVDAFTDDAIPVHLLTNEAFVDAYEPNLSNGGVLAIHISNKYLDLASPISGIAQANGYSAVIVQSEGETENELQNPSHWILLVSPEQVDVFLQFANTSTQERDTILWTDEKSSVLQAFSLSGSL